MSLTYYVLFIYAQILMRRYKMMRLLRVFQQAGSYLAQFAFLAYRERLKEWGFVPKVISKTTSIENALPTRVLVSEEKAKEIAFIV